MFCKKKKKKERDKLVDPPDWVDLNFFGGDHLVKRPLGMLRNTKM
jgi:hypothetical protein